MSLSLLAIGQIARIAKLTGPLDLRRHLTELGFLPGKKIEILQKSFGNQFIVGLEGSKMVLDNKVMRHVQIMH